MRIWQTIAMIGWCALLLPICPGQQTKRPPDVHCATIRISAPDGALLKSANVKLERMHATVSSRHPSAVLVQLELVEQFNTDMKGEIHLPLLEQGNYYLMGDRAPAVLAEVRVNSTWTLPACVQIIETDLAATAAPFQSSGPN